MKRLKIPGVICLSALLLSLVAFAQTPSGNYHFEENGVAFDYPAGWKIINYSTAAVESLTLLPDHGSQQIEILAHDSYDGTCNLEAVGKKLSNNVIEKAALEINATRPIQTAPAKSKIADVPIAGVKIHGLVNKQRVTAEVYSLPRGLRLVSLIYRRVDDAAPNDPAWEVIRSTLTTPPPVLGARVSEPDKAEPTTAASVNSPPLITEGVLNGKAVLLVQPPYPPIARKAHASGTVEVQVIIDESGNVIAAHAKSGHPLLQAASVNAARASKFSPTRLCGEPVRVAGIIQYNFIAQ